MEIATIIKENVGTIVDVRTVEEFNSGNVTGSINIPLQEIDKRMEELKTLKQPLVLCCASGGRSGMATQKLTQLGLDVYNGGSWRDVNYYKSN
jgi:phage shock protein E